MEILDLRQIRAHDLEPLLEEEKSLWREQLFWDYSGSADLIKRFVDSRALSGYAAIEDGRTVGYTFFVYEDYKGLIGDLFVARPFRGPTELRLLGHVIETMQCTPGVRRIEAQLMTFGAGALETSFRQESFRAYTRKFMLLEIGAESPRLAPRPTPGIDFLPWSDRFYEEAAALITRAYHNHVDSLINDQYRSLAGATRFLRSVMNYPGCGVFHPQASCVAHHRGLGMACGLILTSVVSQGVGHVTQICAAPEFRGVGLGYELMRRAVESFREAGFRGLSLTVTSANGPAVELYERLGFRTLREFSAFVWDAQRAGAP